MPGGFGGLWFSEDVLRQAQSLRRARLCVNRQAPLSTRLSRQDPEEGPHVELNFHVDEFSLWNWLKAPGLGEQGREEEGARSSPSDRERPGVGWAPCSRAERLRGGRPRRG